jgi:putative Mg2+ transporter-C (MgtC) family protein
MDWMTEYLPPLLGAVVAGGAIGFEREHRGRAAGMRTHILLCLASALLMLAAVHQVRWMGQTPHDVIRIDPVRMAHGILTGIGFLCGGVIFREGFPVRGLTSAASLWTTAALGVLYGISFYSLAISGTVATLIVLAGLHRIEDRLPRQRHVDVRVSFRRADPVTEGQLRELFARFGLAPDAVAQRLTASGEVIEFSAAFRGMHPYDGQPIADALLADPRVLSFDLAPRHE